jgi:hypothetical protein
MTEGVRGVAITQNVGYNRCLCRAFKKHERITNVESAALATVAVLVVGLVVRIR